jgi:phosphotransferase system HPr-like phosphotransfer protein
MSRTIEAIMRHMTTTPSPVTDQSNRVQKLEKEITVRKRHDIWSEARFVRTMLRFVVTSAWPCNGREVDSKSVLELMMLAPWEGSTVRMQF